MGIILIEMPSDSASIIVPSSSEVCNFVTGVSFVNLFCAHKRTHLKVFFELYMISSGIDRSTCVHKGLGTEFGA